MIQKDMWLSNYFTDGGAYYYDFFKSKLENFIKGFYYTKVSTSDYENLNHLFKKGFFIVETSLLFEQKSILKKIKESDGFTVRESIEFDRSTVVDIASKAFINARFYRDPIISNSLASQIKRDWVDNFFLGKRGTQLFVCENNLGSIIGFSLMKENVIDLIATAPDYAGQGVASLLISYANKKIGSCLRVGTQSTNAASLALYTKNNFSLIETKFTLHSHK